MNLKNKSWSVLALILFSAIGCKKDAASVAIEMKELVKKSQEITCSKTVECAQEQFSKLPESQRKFLPPMLQSKEACLESLTKSAADARAKSGKTEEDEWKEATPEKLAAAKECMGLIEKTSCAELMSPNNPLQKSEACASLNKK